jgi:uncharacterized protein (TIGR02145 family)
MKFYRLIHLISILVIISSCEESNQENPGIFTRNVSDQTPFSAISGGNIYADGLLPVLQRGICWNDKDNPTLYHNYTNDGSGLGNYQSTIINLNAGKIYYVRAYYINEKDTVYGEQIEFVTPDYIIFNPDISYGNVSDIEGNVYKTVTIGSQTWMAENLRTTHYRNGDPINNINDSDFWLHTATVGAYCFFNYDDSRIETFGAYYNWIAATDERNVAPEGWHVATAEDWKILKEFCQGDGNKLRETTSAHWKNSYYAGTNETGFSALAAERARLLPDHEWYFGLSAIFWTGSGTLDFPEYITINSAGEISQQAEYSGRGYSIRCVKD